MALKQKLRESQIVIHNSLRVKWVTLYLKPSIFHKDCILTWWSSNLIGAIVILNKLDELIWPRSDQNFFFWLSISGFPWTLQNKTVENFSNEVILFHTEPDGRRTEAFFIFAETHHLGPLHFSLLKILLWPPQNGWIQTLVNKNWPEVEKWGHLALRNPKNVYTI